MRRAILGTAGHIDHGKTALVRALTGVDTDRLPEEKARGITIDLGFAELSAHDGAEDIRLGVVDVPGHEDFVRTMVAGATGMDVVLLTVAADEGIMPQTREHLEIIRLLMVPSMVVSLTKADLVEEDWLALVEEEVREALSGTAYAQAPVVATSARTGQGIEALKAELLAAASNTRARTEEDVTRLPVDRVFTVQGMGTVATGTLWSGTLAPGYRIRILPGGGEARVRSVQVHGRDTDVARAGERTAAALAGVEVDEVPRGQVLVSGAAWDPTWMLTTRVSLLPGAPRPLEHGARIRVHLGTAEVLARCAVLGTDAAIPPGESGWVQLRLEAPVAARAGDRAILRSYSPLVTVGGAVVAEAVAEKRRKVTGEQEDALDALISGDPVARIEGALALAGWAGVPQDALPQRAAVAPRDVPGALAKVEERGAVLSRGIAFGAHVVRDAEARVLEALEAGHASHPLRASVPLSGLRASLPPWSTDSLADGVLARLARKGALELAEGGARLPGFLPTPTADQRSACESLVRLYEGGGLAAPFVADLPEEMASRPDLAQLLQYLEGQGTLTRVEEGLLMISRVLEEAAREVARQLGGQTDLGPADFRDVLPVSRRHLMPLLAYLDGLGVTVRRGAVRDVPPAP